MQRRRGLRQSVTPRTDDLVRSQTEQTGAALDYKASDGSSVFLTLKDGNCEVTKMTRLIPTPKYLRMFSCVINDPSRLESLIDAVQTLVLQEIFNGNGGLLKKVSIGAPNNISINSTSWRKKIKFSHRWIPIKMFVV